MSRLVALYPRAWRDRYEDEFISLIGERRPTLIERLDIFRGALDAHLHPQVRRAVADVPPSPGAESDLRVARRLGIAAVIGGAVWPAALGVAMMGPIMYDDQGAYQDGTAALPILLVAVGLLAAGLLGQVIRLPREALVARGSALASIPFVLIYGMGPWLFPVGLAAVSCLVVLAIGGWRSGLWPGAASLVVAVACFAVVGILAFALATFGGDRMAGGPVMMVGFVGLIPIWLVVGATLIRRPALPRAAGR